MFPPIYIDFPQTDFVKTPSMSYHHVAKDPEAFEFLKKCFALLEKLQEVPGVGKVPTFDSHKHFLAETQAVVDDKLRKKVMKTVKRSVPVCSFSQCSNTFLIAVQKSNKFIDSDGEMEIIIDSPAARAKVSFLLNLSIHILNKTQSEGLSGSIHAVPKNKEGKTHVKDGAKTKNNQQLSLHKFKKVCFNLAKFLK